MIKNISKNAVLARQKQILTSVLKKALGLMFTFPIRDKGLVFIFKKEMIVDLHMFFVFYPIDVLFLSQDKSVVDMKQGFRPFTVYVSKQPAKYVLELPAGTIEKSTTALDDIIEF